MTISSRAEYEAAIHRIQELGQLPEGTPGAETELTTLVELTTAWEEENEEQAKLDPVVVPSRDRGTL